MAPLSLNTISPVPSSLSETFTLLAPAGSDTWRPPTRDVQTSPVMYEKISLGALRRAKVTVTAAWKAMYDQAGLILMLPTPAPDAADKRPIWVKAGLEVVDGVRNASCVSANPYSDWSLTAMEPGDGNDKFKDALQERGSLTLGFERDIGEDGAPKPGLWVYLELPGGKRQNLRELTWVFDRDESTEAYIGVYAARPKGDDSKAPLEVEIKGFELTTA